MTRARLDYSERTSVQAQGYDPDEPVAGYYRIRLRSGAVFSGVRIWFGPPLDPVTGEKLDRSWRWQAQVNGMPIDLERVWPKCAAEPIDREEYHHLCAVQGWARVNAPNSPQANPFRRIDPLTAPTPF